LPREGADLEGEGGGVIMVLRGDKNRRNAMFGSESGFQKAPFLARHQGWRGMTAGPCTVAGCARTVIAGRLCLARTLQPGEGRSGSGGPRMLARSVAARAVKRARTVVASEAYGDGAAVP